MLEIFAETRIVPVVTIERAEDAVPLARALARGGLGVIEVTFRTAAAARAIREIAREVPGAIVGAGTLLTSRDIATAKEAGAQFLVSPGMTPELAAAGLASGMPYLPGCVTASEIMAARELGLSLLKFFPAIPFGGIATLRQYAPVFPGIAFCPTGGLNGENARDFLALPNVPMVGGSWMAPPESLRAGDWDAITRAAAQTAASVR